MWIGKRRGWRVGEGIRCQEMGTVCVCVCVCGVKEGLIGGSLGDNTVPLTTYYFFFELLLP